MSAASFGDETTMVRVLYLIENGPYRFFPGELTAPEIPCASE
jgi:hypothetical protein